MPASSADVSADVTMPVSAASGNQGTVMVWLPLMNSEVGQLAKPPQDTVSLYGPLDTSVNMNAPLDIGLVTDAVSLARMALQVPAGPPRGNVTTTVSM